MNSENPRHHKLQNNCCGYLPSLLNIDGNNNEKTTTNQQGRQQQQPQQPQPQQQQQQHQQQQQQQPIRYSTLRGAFIRILRVTRSPIPSPPTDPQGNPIDVVTSVDPRISIRTIVCVQISGQNYMVVGIFLCVSIWFAPPKTNMTMENHHV